MSLIVAATGSGGSSGGSSGGGADTGAVVISQSVSDPSGAIDATSEFTAAYATGKPIVVPPGTYTVTNLPATTLSSIEGAGADKTTIRYTGTGTMCTLTSQQRTKFAKIKFALTNSAATLFTLSNTFRATFTQCIFQGSHTTLGDSFSTTTGHIGVRLTANSGDNLFYDCDFLNLGVGIRTDCIQNGVIGGKFGTCYNGIYGFGGGGMSLQGYIDFVAAAGPTPPTDTAINIDGATGQWWLDQVWTEGCTTAIKVGTGTTGPAQFSLTNSKLAAVSTCVNMVAARNPTIFNVYCAGDSANSFTPDPLLVDATGTPEGVAFIDSIVTGKQVDPAAYPIGWTVHSRAAGTSLMKVPNQLQFSYGGKLQMARSDNTVTDTMQVTGGPTLLFRGPGSAGTVVRVLDTGSRTMAEFDTSLTQVNYHGFVPGATGAGPAIVARSNTDTNVDLALTPKGTGDVVVGGGLKLPSYATGSLPTPGAHTGVLAYDSSVGQPKYSNGSGWSTMSGAAGAPAPLSGNYFFPIGGGATSTNTLPNGFLYLSAWDLPNTVTLTRLGIDVSAAGDAGSKIRLGIYADTGAGYPGALVLDAGQLLGDSATMQELTISQTLSAGTYWIGAVGQSITTTAPTVRMASGYTPHYPMGVGTSLPGANTAISSYSQSGVTGLLPSTFSSTVSANPRAPRLVAKAA